MEDFSALKKDSEELINDLHNLFVKYSHSKLKYEDFCCVVFYSIAVIHKKNIANEEEAKKIKNALVSIFEECVKEALDIEEKD